MKKTILLANLIAMTAIAAGTTGTVKGFFESEGNFETNKVVSSDKSKIETKTDKSYKVGKVGIETEVKVKDSGLSFGATFQGKDIVLPLSKNTMKFTHKTANQPDVEIEKYTTDTFFNNSNLFVKYELPEIHKVNSYVKATLNPKVAERVNYSVESKDNVKDKDNVDALKSKELSFKAGNVTIEADVNYSLDDLKVGVNSKTSLPFEKKATYGEAVMGTQKLYINGNYNVVKDIKAELEFNHAYVNSAGKEDALKYIATKFEAAYKEVKDLELKGAINFKKLFNGEELKYKSIMREDDAVAKNESKTAGSLHYVHSYEFDTKYTGVKDLELNGKLFVQHLHNEGMTSKQDDAVSYGTILGVKYTGVKNLTLSGKGVFAGYTNTTDTANTKQHHPYIKLNANAKYDYKVTDKFTVSPELDVTSVLDNFKDTTTLKKNGVVAVATTDLVIKPKVSMEYNPTESLTIKGNVEVPVKFGGTIVTYDKKQGKNNYEEAVAKHGFNYKSTSIKTALNIEYKW